MPTVTVPLETLAQRINQQEAELAKLRQELESRQAQLAKLTQRRDELQAELSEVEAQLQTVGDVAVRRTPAPAASPAKPTVAAPAASEASAKRGPGFVSLPKLLVDIVRRAQRPMTTKELLDAVIRRKYPTTSSNLQAMIETRVGELVGKEFLRRLDGQPGVVLGKAASSAPVKAASPAAAKAPSMPTRPTAKPISAAKAVATGKQPSLKAVITQILQKSPRPLTTQELVDQTLAFPYHTKSKNFRNVIWVQIGEMDNVEHVKDKGYRIKKK
jgi:hypothetical protein